MKCEPCTYSPESEADYLPTSFLDTPQLSLLSGSLTPAKSCANEPQMDGSLACTCGKGMSDCSIHPSTPEAWIASMQDSLAKTLASLESRQAYLREPDQVFTVKSCASLAWFDPNSCSWRTYQQSFLTDSEPYLETWPRWGMTQGGSAYAHPMSERRITETDGSFWQTPTVSCAEHPGQVKHKNGQQLRLPQQVNNPAYWPTPSAMLGSSNLNFQCSGDGRDKPNKLGWAVSMWPTPTTNDAKNSTLPESQRFRDGMAGALMRDGIQAGGQLNPHWVGWLMGFPIEWASLKDMETPKSHCKPQQLTDCLEVCE